jgi:hypothetical protein
MRWGTTAGFLPVPYCARSGIMYPGLLGLDPRVKIQKFIADNRVQDAIYFRYRISYYILIATNLFPVQMLFVQGIRMCSS